MITVSNAVRECKNHAGVIAKNKIVTHHDLILKMYFAISAAASVPIRLRTAEVALVTIIDFPNKNTGRR